MSELTSGLVGIQIIENSMLTEPYEDWSQVRSHGRARRRMKQGHKQRVRHLQKPSDKVYRMDGYLVMHPVVAAALRSRAPLPAPPAKDTI